MATTESDARARWAEEQARRRIRPAADWQPGAEYEDIRYELSDLRPNAAAPAEPARSRVAKITIDRPELRNAFRPETLIEISDSSARARTRRSA